MGLYKRLTKMKNRGTMFRLFETVLGRLVFVFGLLLALILNGYLGFHVVTMFGWIQEEFATNPNIGGLIALGTLWNAITIGSICMASVMIYGFIKLIVWIKEG